ncbi:hypothetical protein P7K49_022137 [Saguinus oedipus]|uniref:Uncharacterized protein n=1 Tax=Saguinus oedipus TaxID=9490 RepID=A0ABQ9UUL6_SAGOE|nr:hypothetical protein P7K49_022137 [Saguinus oedipus]
MVGTSRSAEYMKEAAEQTGLPGAQTSVSSQLSRNQQLTCSLLHLQHAHFILKLSPTQPLHLQMQILLADSKSSQGI